MGSRRERGRVNEVILGVLLTALGLFLGAGLLPGDLTGPVGGSAGGFFSGSLGWGAVFVPAALLVAGWVFLRGRPLWFLARRVALVVVSWALAETALGLAGGDYLWGGSVGASLAGALRSSIGSFGSWVFLTAAVIVFAVAVWREALLESRALHAIGPAGRRLGTAASQGAEALWSRLRPPPGEAEVDAKPARKKAEKPEPESKRPEHEPKKPVRLSPEPKAPVIHGPPDAVEAAGAAAGAARKPARARDAGHGGEPDLFAGAAAVAGAPGAANGAGSGAEASGAGDVEIPVGGPTPLPPVSLLTGVEGPVPVVSHEDLRQGAQTLTEKLEDFGVHGQVGEIHPGPVITRFEFEPAPGIKVAQVTSRVDDLALALRASRIRIVAPIPGKAAIGVEIPNREPALISLKEIVATDAFLNSPGQLTLAFGKDIGGAPFYASLEKMPHLLIAGTTGSGKSVCINSIIMSLLLRLTPERMRMILIDPKMLELTVYNQIPHLLTPVVTEARDAARALHWLTGEMERRYRRFAEKGVRNIQVYHERFGAAEPVPYVVVVVDELADLMLTDAGEIEAPIARLAQMARAVGIHLILATQRPSVDVLTGVIKANFPARIAFQVASRVDSRTILDMNGAESLIGRGDMLFLPPGAPEPHRVHGAFVSDKEIERIVEFLARFRAATPRIDIVAEAAASGGAAGGDEDPLFEDAARIVITHQQGSVSLLQRRLKVGYSRAARLMDQLEAAGIVGPPDGSKAREVLADLTALDRRGDDDL